MNSFFPSPIPDINNLDPFNGPARSGWDVSRPGSSSISRNQKNIPSTNVSAINKRDYEHYVDNGGTVLAIAGPDFVVTGSDTRLSDGGYGIRTRNDSKSHILSENTLIVSAGMQADRITLCKDLDAKIKMYKFEHNGRAPSSEAIANMLGVTLYYHRFAPYYTFNLVAGLDSEGKGGVWSYDAIGSHQRVAVSCAGSAQSLLQPLLDNQMNRQHQSGLEPKVPSLEEALVLVKDAFASAGERDIYTGDSVEINILTKDGLRKEILELRKD